MTTRYDDDTDTTLTRFADLAFQAVSFVLALLLATPFVLILTAPFIG